MADSTSSSSGSGGNSATGASDSPATGSFKKKMQTLATALSDYGESAAPAAARQKGLSSGS